MGRHRHRDNRTDGKPAAAGIGAFEEAGGPIEGPAACCLVLLPIEGPGAAIEEPASGSFLGSTPTPPGGREQGGEAALGGEAGGKLGHDWQRGCNRMEFHPCDDQQHEH